jgi:hypothetical protein
VPFDCPSCTTAAREVSHEFTANCRGCMARAAARSPQAHEWRRRGGPPTHAARLLLDQFGLTADEVKAAARADMLGKEPA